MSMPILVGRGRDPADILIQLVALQPLATTVLRFAPGGDVLRGRTHETEREGFEPSRQV
jgi:hypothetical protein